MGKRKKMGLYIHIPFCLKKCNYCDFVSFKADNETKESYMKALLLELRDMPEKYCFDPKEYIISSVYIGGGTPSTMEGSQIYELLKRVRDNYRLSKDAEITIEINPGTVENDSLEIYRQAGLNRISIGLQSANPKELALLGRIHSFEDFKKCYHMVRNKGFDNVNVDIMTALPGQSLEKLGNTLRQLMTLGPDHISAYSLIIEPGTAFYKDYSEGGSRESELPGEEEERRLYYYTRDFLKEWGYHQYEISNFAKKGKESKHNSAYWRRQPYIGLGLNASSLMKEIRYKNTPSTKDYLKDSNNTSSFVENIVLSKEEQMDEFMFLGLRMNRGVFKADFERQFNALLLKRYGEVIKKLLKEELIEEDKERIRLTYKGMDYGNYVFSNFYLGDY
ncbi:MAG: radical SAM family heme chaperone HemW [Lachnospiraceae bacterium]|nr:radical SAM family heme chaperone HemW [Lachnospiraceae bacterium]